MDALERWRKENPGYKPVRHNPLERFRSKPSSLRLAITAKCWQCEGEDADPGVRWRIGNCLCPDCALYPVRPYQHLLGKEEPKALRQD